MLALALTLFTSTQTKPPTLDPTYGFPIPKLSHPAKLPPDAKWIWADEVRDKQTIELKRQFSVSRQPSSAKLYISVDNFYSVSLDGTLLGKTEDGRDDVDGWNKAKPYDVASLLTPGTHTLTVTAYNVAGAAGVLARLQADGKPLVVSDKQWQASDGAGSGDWKPATEEDAIGGGPWGSVSGWPVEIDSVPGYLHHLPLDPIAVCNVPGSPDFDHLPWGTTGHKISVSNPGGGDPWKVVIDFGKELSGRVSVSAAAPCTLKVGTGESSGEAIEKPWTSAELTLDDGKPGFSPYTSLRYACLTFPASVSSANLDVKMDHLYYPVQYKGSFDCSDPLLTKIWYTGAYTAHLCMQQDIWDAPKRDRARWMGDLHVSGEVINDAFLDRFLMEQTIQRLRDDAQGGKPATELPAQHVNGIPGYSCAWLAGLADLYRHTGDIAYVRSQKDAIVTLLEYLRTELDSDGVFANNHKQWPYVDWSVDFDKDTPQARATTHLFLIKAVKEGAFLLGSLGDSAAQKKYQSWADDLTTTAQRRLLSREGTFGDRRQENAMAIFSGATTQEETAKIYDSVFRPDSPAWNKDATPYYNNYVIYAMSQAGHTKEAIDFVRSYWGGMLAEGATTFWEGYDLSWDKHNAHVHLGADDGIGYFVSLCHGWSAGSTAFLTDRVLGIRPTSGGFATFDVVPDLGDLAWASGTVPTPQGGINIKVKKSGTGYAVHIVVPSGTRAALGLPGKIRIIEPNIQGASEISGNGSVVTLKPGTYDVESG